MNKFSTDAKHLWNLGLDSIRMLETDQGILASSQQEIYNGIFGRDSLITSLKLLRVYKKTGVDDLIRIARKSLLTLAKVQGVKINIESGEEPGKIIHEYRPTNHEHLSKRPERPWFVYEDQALRNYDSVDSTPLFLISVYRYWQYTNDLEFIEQILPNVKAALEWIRIFGDSNGDGFVDYQMSKDRLSGGLTIQNWMDSLDSVFHETEGTLIYPMAPVEVQAYVYLALALWSKYFVSSDPQLSQALWKQAVWLKKVFNEKYITTDPNGNIYLAWKLDGEGKQFRSVRSNMGHVLWASTNKRDDGEILSILDKKLVPHVVRRLMMPDIFEPIAGIRTLSILSRNFKPNSYHNGSIWPHDNSMISEGFEIHGYKKEAEEVKQALLNSISHFDTPIELLVFIEGNFSDYCSSLGQKSCKIQAWSAAALLDTVS